MTLRKSLSSQEPGSKRLVKSAWLECKHSPSKGTDDGGDDSREGVDYTINEVTVEVHLNPNLISSNYKFTQKPNRKVRKNLTQRTQKITAEKML